VCTPSGIFYLLEKKYTGKSYECSSNSVNIFGKGMILSDSSEVSLAVTVLCWLQFYGYWRRTVNKAFCY